MVVVVEERGGGSNIEEGCCLDDEDVVVVVEEERGGGWAKEGGGSLEDVEVVVVVVEDGGRSFGMGTSKSSDFSGNVAGVHGRATLFPFDSFSPRVTEFALNLHSVIYPFFKTISISLERTRPVCGCVVVRSVSRCCEKNRNLPLLLFFTSTHQFLSFLRTPKRGWSVHSFTMFKHGKPACNSQIEYPSTASLESSVL